MTYESGEDWSTFLVVLRQYEERIRRNPCANCGTIQQTRLAREVDE